MRDGQERSMFHRAIVRPPGSTFPDGLTTMELGRPDLARAREQHRAYGAVADLRPVYRFEDEALWELSNQTIHALLHLSWMGGVPPAARLAVYVKHRGVGSRLYMAAIKPFRYAVVYPTWIREIERAWSAR